MGGEYNGIINRVKSKIEEIETPEIKECLYTFWTKFGNSGNSEEIGSAFVTIISKEDAVFFILLQFAFLYSQYELQNGRYPLI
jgi:hypothetical protein